MTFSIEPPQQNVLSQILGEAGAGFGAGLQESLDKYYQAQDLQRKEQQFIDRGVRRPLARLMAVATTGGQTEVLKEALEEMKRGQPSFLSEQMTRGPEGEEIQEEDIDVGLTPQERIKREEGRFTRQGEKYAEIGQKTEGFGQEQMRLQRLQELNEAGNLPKGLGRLNVNLKSGELILPFGGSADSQEFVKIVNDFLSGAKNTFGARVTNFEVNRFLRRLPSLLNTEEGRRRVLRQMEIINQINNSYNQAILDEFDRAGGVRKIDYDVAVRRAKKKIEPEKKRLQKEYVRGRDSQTQGQLTEDIAREILREAGGDREKARSLARRRGYQF